MPDGAAPAAAALGLRLVALHARLAELEWKREQQRLEARAAATVTRWLATACAAQFAGLLLLALTWSTAARIPTALALAAACAALAWWANRRGRRLAAATPLFALTRAQLQKDLALLGPRHDGHG